MNAYEYVVIETTLVPVAGETGGVVYQNKYKIVAEGKVLAKDREMALAAAGTQFGKFNPETMKIIVREFKAP